MSRHLEEKRIEHLELKLNWNYIEESEIIAKQSVMIETMSQEIIKSLKEEMLVVQHLTQIPIKLEWRITKLPDNKMVLKTIYNRWVSLKVSFLSI